MRIFTTIYNTTTGEKIWEFSSPDIDSSITEHGRYERIMENGSQCLYCGEPLNTTNDFCGEDCSLAFTTNNQIKNESSNS